MPRIIAGKLDCVKIDRTKLFAGKNGAKYLDFILVETPDNKYGDDFMVCQSVSKEDRLAGKKGAILGNAKYLGGGGGQAPATSAAAPKKPAAQENLDEDIPF